MNWKKYHFIIKEGIVLGDKGSHKRLKTSTKPKLR